MRPASVHWMPAERRHLDIIGEVHGCSDELAALESSLGYAIGRNRVARHPAGRRSIFVGDLVDIGLATNELLEFGMATCAAGTTWCVEGNHERRLRRALGHYVEQTHGLRESIEQLAGTARSQHAQIVRFSTLAADADYSQLNRSCSSSHAGLPAKYHGVESRFARGLALFGPPSDDGDWRHSYPGTRSAEYGHNACHPVEWRNNALCIDAGCVYGGELTALRYPEIWIMQVISGFTYDEHCLPNEDG
jgi:protein phosphatase